MLGSSTIRRCAWTLLSAAVLSSGSSLPADARSSTVPPDRDAEVVEGQQRALVLVPPGVAVSDYRNEGYSLRRGALRADGYVEVEIEITASVRSVGETDAVSGRSAGRRQSASVERLARALTARHEQPEERARRLAAWVARNIEYRLDRSLPQTPEAVLERRDAYCTGAARLLVALFEAAGLEAREVPGYAVAGTPTNRVPGFHRWVEYRPPRGEWRFVDPLSTFGFVPASFVRLADERLQRVALEVGWNLVEFQDALRPVGHDGVLPPGVFTVAMAGMRPVGARVRVLGPAGADGDETYRVVLRGRWVRERTFRADGQAVFVNVAPGTYDVVLERRSPEAGRGEGRAPFEAARIFQRSLVITESQASDGALLNVVVSSGELADREDRTRSRRPVGSLQR